ncbi:MAG TPA: DUF4388 domain-containing protein, partial [Myxococcales bacterium]|nr:DUF4388 domain-containing protein [Myxococcales bacterium]
MSSGGRQYWIKTEQGRVWGPYDIDALERLRGQLTERAQASLDGQEFRPGADFPELRSLLSAPRSAPRPAAATRFTPPNGMYVGPALRAMLEQGVAKKQATSPAMAPVAPAPLQPSPPVVARSSGPPVMRPTAVVHSEKLELPPRGNLNDVSPVRLYALAALNDASGMLELELESGRKIAVSFRRGTPDHVSSDDPELSFLRFLQSRKAIAADQAVRAEEHAAQNGVDVVSALFQLQLIPPADAHKVLGEHALFLLDRALEAWRGSFEFKTDVPSPPGAFALGQKWTLLTEAVRRMDIASLSARLSRQLARPVQRSGGSSIGKLEELALTAQEARLFAAVDGTRSGEELVQQHAAAMPARILYLLSELKHLSFSEIEEARAAPEPPAAPVPSPARATSPAIAPVPPAATPG